MKSIAARYEVSSEELIRWNPAHQLDTRQPVAGRILQVRSTVVQTGVRTAKPSTGARRPAPVRRQPDAGRRASNGSHGTDLLRIVPSSDAVSVGAPHDGRLERGVQLPSSELYDVAYGPVAYGSAHTIALIVRALGQFRHDTRYPGRVVIGAISKLEGGPFEPHRSHQSGRDVDVHLPHRNGRSKVESARDVDWVATWALIRAFVATQQVEVVFLDQELHAFLRNAGEATGASPKQVQAIMKHVAHVPGHRKHLHVRIRCGANEDRCR